MPRATCRCGQVLSFPADGPERVVCPTCGARIRVRRPSAEPVAALPPGDEDGYLRFSCPCGRRLKVVATFPRPEAGKCPDCGRVVPVPASLSAKAPTGPETPTEDLDTDDLAALDRWAASKTGRAAAPEPAAEPEPETPPVAPVAAPVRVEAGLRVCPRCGRPVHLGAETCRQCGAHVPKR